MLTYFIDEARIKLSVTGTIAMRRLIEGLDELAGHDVVLARGGESQGQTCSVPGAFRRRMSRRWMGMSLRRIERASVPVSDVPPIEAVGSGL